MNLDSPKKPKSSGAGDALMIALSLVSVFLLFFEVLADHTPSQTRSLELADLTIKLFHSQCYNLCIIVYSVIRASDAPPYKMEVHDAQKQIVSSNS